jgi:hypothetical protein
MPIKVFMAEQDIIEVDYIDDFSLDEMKRYTEPTLKFVKELQAQGKKSLILINAEKMNIPNTEERQYGSELMKNFPYDKIAAYGDNKLGNFIINLLVKVSNVSDKVRVFSTRDEAITWLRA